MVEKKWVADEKTTEFRQIELIEKNIGAVCLIDPLTLLTSYIHRGFSMLNRRFSIVLLSLLILGTSILTIITLPEVLRASAASTPTIALFGSVTAWNSTTNPNPTITVTQGQDLTIQLTSSDNVLHRFFIDVDKNGPTPDCPGMDVCSNAFTTTTTLTFTVNFAPGTYTYYCSVHPTSMLGSFIVQAPPPPPPIANSGGLGRHPM
jgi:plastocyanin